MLQVNVKKDNQIKKIIKTTTAISPCKPGVLLYLQISLWREFISVTTNWSSTYLVLFVQILLTQRLKYLQRSAVRQSKQDRTFCLIRTLIVIDLLFILQTAVQEYFLSFHSETVSVLWAVMIWLFSVGSYLSFDWFVWTRNRNRCSSIYCMAVGLLKRWISSYSIMNKESGEF